MLSAYVGIAHQDGLEVFVPEHEHVVRFLARRVRREALRRTICYWAVLPDDAARETGRLLEIGEPYAALITLVSAARDFGPILPQGGVEPDAAGTPSVEHALP
jgi:hypothetical protein